MTNPRGTWTLFKRETKRFLKVWMQTLLAPVISNLLFLAIFGLSLRDTAPIEGLSYMQFLIPGLIIMGLINNAYQNPSSSMIIMKYQGMIYDLMTIPLRRVEIFSAFMASAVFRALLVGFMTFLTGLFFTGFPYFSIFTICFAVVFVSLFFSAFGLIVGIWADDFDPQAFIQNFILTPLAFLGGVFYPVSKLPDVFQTISLLNPIVYMIDLLRYGFTGIHEFPINLSYAVVATSTILLSFIAYYLLRIGFKLQT